MYNNPLALAWNPWVGGLVTLIGLVFLLLVWLFGQPRKEQGKRRPAPAADTTVERERREPTFGDAEENSELDELPPMRRDPLFDQRASGKGELDAGLREELEKLGAALADERQAMPKPTGHAASIVEALRAPSLPQEPTLPLDLRTPTPATPIAAPASSIDDDDSLPFELEEPVVKASVPTPAPAPVAPPAPRVPPRSDLGKRPPQMAVERIVSLFVIAREGEAFNGADLIVAAEKAGLEYGDMGIYHRLVDNKRELGPIFSVANMLKPGSFDLSRVDALRTPGLSFFMALPGPVSALDAWDTMLPAAQRLAELLDGQVLDEERNALGRQRIAHIRDELRGWDRNHDGEEIQFGR